MGAEDLHHRYDDPPRGEVTGELLMLRNSKIDDNGLDLQCLFVFFIKVEAQSALNT